MPDDATRPAARRTLGRPRRRRAVDRGRAAPRAPRVAPVRGRRRTLVVVGDGRAVRAGPRRAPTASAGRCSPSRAARVWRAGALRGRRCSCWAPDSLDDAPAGPRPRRWGARRCPGRCSALLADPAVHVETVSASPRWADAARQRAVGATGSPVDPRGERVARRTWLAAWPAAAGARAARPSTRRSTSRRRAHRRPAGPRPGRRAARRARCWCSGPPRRSRDVDRCAGRAARPDASWPTAGSPASTARSPPPSAPRWRHGGPAFALMGDLTFLHDAHRAAAPARGSPRRT